MTAGDRRGGGGASLRSPECPPPSAPPTVRDALGLGLAVGLYGAAFGAAADAAGLNVWQAVSLSALMFTGASQFALVGVLGAGGSALAAVGSALLLGTRNTVYGVRLVPLLRPHGRSAGSGRRTGSSTRRRRCRWPPRPGARQAGLPRHRRVDLPDVERDDRRRRAGRGRRSAGTARAALDAVVPAAFLALLWPRLRSDVPRGGGPAAGRARRGRRRAGADAVRARRRAGDRGGRGRRAGRAARAPRERPTAREEMA